MNEYLRDNLPATFEALSAQWAAMNKAVDDANAARAAERRAQQSWIDAKAKADAEACAHFAANNKPSGVVVPADLLARVAKAIDTPALQWDSDARRFRERAEGAVATVASIGNGNIGRFVLRLCLYVVDDGRFSAPGWSRVATLEVWAHSGTIAGSGGRKRVVSEEDVAALMALGRGEVTT